MEEFDETEVIRGSELRENADQAALRFLRGGYSRLVQPTAILTEKSDSMEATLQELQKTLSLISKHLGKYPIAADSSHQFPPVTHSDPYIRDDHNRLPLNNSTSLLPEFDGSNASDWLSNVERFFGVGRYSDLDKLDLVAFSLEGYVLQWFSWEMSHREFHSWEEFRRRLLLKFGAASEESSETVTGSLEARASYQVPVSPLEPGLSFSSESLYVSEAWSSDIMSNNRIQLQSGFECVKNKTNAHQVLDKTSPHKDRLKSKSKRMLSLSPKTWMFKFKHTANKRKSLDVKSFSVEEIAWLMRDSKEIYRSCVDKEFKAVVAGCGKQLFDRFQIVDGTSTLAVYGSMLLCNLRVRQDLGGLGQLILDDLKSHLRHKWKSKHIQAVVGLQNNLSYALDVVECKTTAAIFSLVLEQSVSHDCFLDSLWEQKNVSWLGIVYGLADCTLYSLFSCELDTNENMSSGLSQTRQVWEPGGVLASHLLVDWLVDFHDYAEIVEGIRCLVIGLCSGIQQPIDSRRASRVWERGGVDMSTALPDENDIMRLGWMVFDRGKNNIISGDVITPLMNAWYSCQQEETTSAESSSALQRDEAVSVVHQQRIIADSVADTRVETVVVEESAISEPEAEAVVDVRFDDVDRGELLFKEQDHDASETSWMFSKEFVRLYHHFKLEDKLIFQEGSIDTIKQSYYRKEKQVVTWQWFQVRGKTPIGREALRLALEKLLK